ncbi:hypothetical protein HRI_003157000 [Hibiscus trionum]|uniref:Uncharacterized protein n=1 Tax=Hibiscus trionum TaxID=183268 RepID=A0A9W7M934_HIBTR|nr:hypothetical protein HRI_003157000 [Hibiscus trionum]
MFSVAQSVETLRDNLILTLQGDEGNEISRTGIEIRLVVQKGVWDDIFSVEGGGHVHMKLQFLLSEEEHQRIWMMVDADVGTAAEANANGKTSQTLRPRSENSEDPQDSMGPAGQVIKVIIMIGFATLVLLTRKEHTGKFFYM